MKTTRRKTKVIGTESYINRDTGEILDMEVIEIEERDANFHKLWLGHIMQTLDIIGNQKMKVVNYLLENMNSENQLISTQQKIVKDINVSIQTVSTTIRALIDNNFMVMEQPGVYRINPNVIFKGGKNRRMNVLFKYHEVKNGEPEGDKPQEEPQHEQQK